MAKTLTVSVPGSDVYAMIVYGAGYTEVRVLRQSEGPLSSPDHVHSFRLTQGKGSARHRVQVYLETVKRLTDEKIRAYVA